MALALLALASAARGHDGLGTEAHRASARDLLVATHLDGPLPCAPHPEPDGFVVAGGVAVAFLANATDLQATFIAPPGSAAFLAAALPTGGAVRALVEMAERDVALHALGAFREPLPGQASWSFRSGTLGLLRDAPGAAEPLHAGTAHGPSMFLAYEGGASTGACQGEAGHVAVRFPRAGLADATPGSLVAATLLVDPAGVFLPRPTERTVVLTVPVYLARPEEGAGTLRAAFSSAPDAAELAPLAALAAGIAALAFPGLRGGLQRAAPPRRGRRGRRPPGPSAAKRFQSQER